MARVTVNGVQIATKFFPPGKLHGPQWRAAKEWEEKQKETTLARTPTGLELLMQWGDKYLDHAKRTMGRQTYVEKQLVMKDLFVFCRKAGIHALAGITPVHAYTFLSGLNDARGGNVANKYKKNLMAAWAWGLDFVEGFPQIIDPFRKVKRFPFRKRDRYVPPEEDMIKVLQQAKGQDLIMLLTMYFTGARRGEIFRLEWKDVDLKAGKIRLTDHKGGDGQERVRWLQMHPELIKALSLWNAARPCRVENVFMQVHNDGAMGKPFTSRMHFMKTICERAKVKPFGFHALRHKAAAITFVDGGGLSSAQILMGHARATTTDIYIRSFGLYADQGPIIAALGGSGIGQATGSLLEKSFPQEEPVLGENCNPEYVTQ
jgi:integrase